MSKTKSKLKFVKTSRVFQKCILKGTILEVFKAQIDKLGPASRKLSIHYSTLFSALSVAISIFLLILGSEKMKPNVLFYSWVGFWVAVVVVVISVVLILCTKNPVTEIVDEIIEQNK